jgi:hypothetical protein
MGKKSMTKEMPSTIIVLELSDFEEASKSALSSAFALLNSDCENNVILLLLPWDRERPLGQDLWLSV